MSTTYNNNKLILFVYIFPVFKTRGLLQIEQNVGAISCLLLYGAVTINLIVY